MSIVTKDEVFEFMGTDSSVAAKQAGKITDLITREQAELESTLGRKVEKVEFEDVIFQNELNCRIYKSDLYLTQQYRDTYDISAISEVGTVLVASVGYNDGGDYYLDAAKGKLIRINQNWSQEQLAIKMSGKLGLVDRSNGNPLFDIKQTLIELVSVKSGLWKTTIEDPDGDIQVTTKNISTFTKNMIKKYTLRDF